jgi:Tol biopolymer transport system component
MAYWRAAANGILELWVSDLDGDHRSRIATASADTDLALTRWSPDGSAVAYTIGGTTLGMAWLDATNATLLIPTQLRAARWRIVSLEWSPDAKRVAATFRAGGGLSNESDVYVAEAKGSATWERVTTTGDAFAGRWIDQGRLFIETASGVIAVLDLATKQLRPITGLPATSPLIGRDGRVYFTGGRFVGGDVSTQPVAGGWVWSATIDGDDVRRETTAEQAQARLFGALADGRFVTGVPGGVYFAGDALVPLAFVGAGTVRRVVVSDDGRRVIGITDQRILQIDAAKMPRALDPGTLPPPAAAATLLSGVRDADVWAARKTVALAHAPATTGGPKARLAFVLGRTLWQADPDGAVRSVLSEPSFVISAPRWSGDRFAVVLTRGSPFAATIVVIAPSGTRRWEGIGLGTTGTADWSPDGTTISVHDGTLRGEWMTRSYDAETGAAKEAIAGRAVWSPAGRLVLTDGESELQPNAPPALRTGQRIELVEGADRRTITDARRIAASPLLKDVPDATLPPAISGIAPSGGPAYVGVSLSRVRQSGAGAGASAFVVVRMSDGEPVYVLSLPPQNGPFDLAWAPTGYLLGWDVAEGLPLGTVRRAVVVDPVAGRTILRVDGRFAGWTADGMWAYVARDEGLYAYRADGSGDPVRVGPFGVTVAAAKP